MLFPPLSDMLRVFFSYQNAAKLTAFRFITELPMSSDYFAVVTPNLLKKQPFPFMAFQFFILMQCFYLDAVFFEGVGLVQAEGLLCCSSQVLKPMWNGRCGWESLSWGIISFSCVSGAVEISAEPQWSSSPWCFSLEHWAFALPKLFQELCFFQDVGPASVQTSAFGHLQRQDPQCRLAFYPWGAWGTWADSKDPCMQDENMVFTLYHFSAVPVWNMICSLTVSAGEEVTDLKRQAVEEMMDRIKKGVHLRPVNQSSRPKTKVWNKQQTNNFS